MDSATVSVFLISAFVFVALVLAIVRREINAQLGVIHDLVNSNLSKVTTDLKLAEQRIAQLERHIAGE